MTEEPEWLPSISGEEEDLAEAPTRATLSGSSEEHVVPPTLILDEEAEALAKRDLEKASTEKRRAVRAPPRPQVDEVSGRHRKVTRAKRPVTPTADAFESGASRSELEIPTAEHPSHKAARRATTVQFIAIGLAVVAIALAAYLALALFS